MTHALYRVDEFAHTIIPSLLKGKKERRVALASYTTIGEYEDGPLTTGLKGLDITLSIGGSELPAEFLFGWGMAIATDHGPARIDYTRRARDDARTSQLAAEAGLANAEMLPDILVMYAGLRAFEQTVVSAVRFRKKAPKTYIALLTCDCRYGEKVPRLTPLLGKKVDAAIITPHCGGRAEMAEITEAFLLHWPKRNSRARKRG